MIFVYRTHTHTEEGCNKIYCASEWESGGKLCPALISNVLQLISEGMHIFFLMNLTFLNTS